MPEFTYLGIEYRLVATGEWDFVDALYAKNVSGGMSVQQIERGVMDADPDAMIAMIAVSVKHGRVDTPPAELLRSQIVESGMNLMGWFKEISRDEIGEVVVPPDEAAEAADSPSTMETTLV